MKRRIQVWQVVETAIWANVPVLFTVLALAGMISQDQGTTILGLLGVVVSGWKAAKTL